jgi:general stress protein 26
MDDAPGGNGIARVDRRVLWSSAERQQNTTSPALPEFTPPARRNPHAPVPTRRSTTMAGKKETTERLAKLMEKLDVAMLTTVGDAGYLVSRPLSTQAAQFDGERVWFFTEFNTPKVAEIRRHPKVNLAYASKEKNTYISAAGDARINQDRAMIGSLWSDALKAFFPNGKDDPNLALIEVRLRTVEYWDGPGTLFGQAITFVVASVTGNDDVMGENLIVDMATGRSRKPAGSDRGGTKGSAHSTPRVAGRTARKKAGTQATAKKPPAKAARSAVAGAGKPAAGRTGAAGKSTRKAPNADSPAKKRTAGKKLIGGKKTAGAKKPTAAKKVATEARKGAPRRR